MITEVVDIDITNYFKRYITYLSDNYSPIYILYTLLYNYTVERNSYNG